MVICKRSADSGIKGILEYRYVEGSAFSCRMNGNKERETLIGSELFSIVLYNWT